MTDIAGETPEQRRAREERDKSMAEYKAWKAEKEAARRGQEAIDDAVEWTPPGHDPKPRPKRKKRGDAGGGDGAGDDAGDGDGGGDDDGDGDEVEGDPGRPRDYRPRRIQRYNDKGKLVWTLNNVPDGCPVIPLGADGLTFWYLNPRGQLVPMEAGKFGLTHIKGLFGKRIPYAEQAWPKFNAQGTHTGFAAEAVCDALIMGADAKGTFDARDKVRGRGCWRGPNNELIQHLGDRILIDGREMAPGEIVLPLKGTDEEVSHVYPGRPRLPAGRSGGKADCEEIYKRLGTWQWMRGDLDARLLLGWMACVVLGSALDWRPMVFWMGDAGTGKSTLQRYVRQLLFGRLVSTVDASAASLRQMIQMDSLGVAFDELEADQHNEQARQVVKLARCAASGDKIYRGGQDHKAAEFALQGCFGFSAIVPPPMGQADTQRFAFLRLKKQPKGARTPKWSEADLRQLGQSLVGRITEGWPQWQEVLDAYRAGLERAGHEQRGQDQFGTLLAAAEMLLHDGVPDADSVDEWCDRLRRDTLSEYEDTQTAWQQAWSHILRAQPEAWRSSGLPTVHERLSKYWWLCTENSKAAEGKMRELNQMLQRAGLAIVHDKRNRPWLAIPTKGHAIAKIFEGHTYQGGAWTNALRGADPGKPEGSDGVWRADQVRAFNREYCTLYRLDAEVDGVPVFDPGPAPSEGPEIIEAGF